MKELLARFAPFFAFIATAVILLWLVSEANTYSERTRVHPQPVLTVSWDTLEGDARASQAYQRDQNEGPYEHGKRVLADVRETMRAMPVERK